MRLQSRSASVWACLCLIPFCVSCAATAPIPPPIVETVVEHKVVKISPPKHLLLLTVAPSFVGSTCGEVIEHTVALRESLASCNADKAAVLDWLAPEAP